CPGLAGKAVILIGCLAGRGRVVRKHIHASRPEERAPITHARTALDERRMRSKRLQRAFVRHAPGKERRELPAAFFHVQRRPELARRGKQRRHQLKARVIPGLELGRARLGLQKRAVLGKKLGCVHYQRRVSSTPASYMTWPPTTVSTERIFFRSSFGTLK